MILILRDPHLSTAQLAERLTDVLYGRWASTYPDETSQEHPRWDVGGVNDVWLHETGEPGVWRLSFRYGAPRGLADLFVDRRIVRAVEVDDAAR